MLWTKDKDLKKLKKQFQAAGMSADSMDKYQLKALAETLGTLCRSNANAWRWLSDLTKEQMKMKEASEELNKTMGQMTLAVALNEAIRSIIWRNVYCQ